MNAWPNRPRRTGLLIVAGAASVALLAAALPANAQPPQGKYQSETVIVCDTAEQIRSIVAAGKNNDETGAFTQFTAFAKQLNAAKEPACTIVDVNAAADQAIELGTFSIFAATPRHAWAVHITHGSIDGWMLYTEAAPENGGRAIAFGGDLNAPLI
jgi:hypothetical protein